MEIFKYFQVILGMLLFLQALAVPVQNDQFCTGKIFYYIFIMVFLIT